MVRISYGPMGWIDDIQIMRLEDGIHGIQFVVPPEIISEGAVAFDALLFAPAMLALERRVARYRDRSTDFPVISFNNVVPT